MKSSSVFIYVYRVVFVPLAAILGILGLLFHAKFRQSVLLKLKGTIPKKVGSVWIHAASGEFEYAKPLLPILSERFSNLLVTYSSPSYVKSIQSSPFVTESHPLPLDLPGPVTSFLKAARPQMILFSRTDLWPELIWQARARGIPTYIFAVTEKDRRGIGSRLAGRLKAVIYNQMTGVFCVSQEDQNNLISMGVKTPIEILGDPRIDQVLTRLSQPNPNRKVFPPSTSLTITLGSTWPEDEKILWPALEPFLERRQIRVLWAPHEPSDGHFVEHQKRMKQKGIGLQRYSEATQLAPGEVLYVDTIGVLADLYAQSEVAFVGGSFKAKVHSVMEPLAHGNWVWVGPYNQNNREAQVFKSIESPLGTMVQELRNPTELRAALDRAIQTSKEFWPKQKQQTQEKIESLKGASRRIVERL